MKENLARKLRILRAAKGITLDEAERLSGVTRETIGALEHAQRGAHTRTLEKLAEAYDVHLEYLVGSGPALAGASSGKAEAPTGADQGADQAAEADDEAVEADDEAVEADDEVGMLLERLGSKTMHLAEGDLARTLEDAPLKDVLKASREARKEALLLVPEIRRLLKDAKVGSPEYLKAMRVWGDAATRLHRLRWLIRARRGVKLYEISPDVSGRDQGQDQDPRQDRLAGEVAVEMEGLRELAGALG